MSIKRKPNIFVRVGQSLNRLGKASKNFLDGLITPTYLISTFIWKATENKAVSLETHPFGFAKNIIFQFNIDWTRKMDHAGFHVELIVLGGMIEFDFCDMRHWDYDNDCWEVYVVDDVPEKFHEAQSS
jgi:hypothetical protein